MTKYKIKERIVLDGDITNSYWKDPTPIKKAWQNNNDSPVTSKIICLPDKTEFPFPTTLERFRLITAIKKAGIYVGLKVIRVDLMNSHFINNPHMHGTVKGFAMTLVNGYNEYKPILVAYKDSSEEEHIFAFSLNEIESLDKARKELNIPAAEPNDIADKIIADLEKQRHGVVPFKQHSFYNPY